VKVWERNRALVGHFNDHVFEAAFVKKACSATIVLDDDHDDVVDIDTANEAQQPQQQPTAFPPDSHHMFSLTPVLSMS
jgi:alpha/beta superfamily hydrolase